jgi:hypothetical protein
VTDDDDAAGLAALWLAELGATVPEWSGNGARYPDGCPAGSRRHRTNELTGRAHRARSDPRGRE